MATKYKAGKVTNRLPKPTLKDLGDFTNEETDEADEKSDK